MPSLQGYREGERIMNDYESLKNRVLEGGTAEEVMNALVEAGTIWSGYHILMRNVFWWMSNTPYAEFADCFGFGESPCGGESFCPKKSNGERFAHSYSQCRFHLMNRDASRFWGKLDLGNQAKMIQAATHKYMTAEANGADHIIDVWMKKTQSAFADAVLDGRVSDIPIPPQRGKTN